ncbi:SH3 domain-containing protein [Streptosporangium sp. NBC_01495]|uniref:SH3 domain-containing protein n=1 Tax=Streptosporangium sp. NBC_01495 TaxID=2903899 RepID=UPI002E2F447C|nr:SH3 domain-containing protein [Streptosporangium sp. NBC_01495]
MTAKRTTVTLTALTALTACAAAGGLIWTALPVHATARLTETTPTPALACTYQVTNVYSDTVLTVRSQAGQTFSPVGTLRADETPVAGACESVNGWVQVKTTAAVTGWVPSSNLRKLTSSPAATGQPTPACAYRVNHTGRSRYVTLRSGTDKTSRSVGTLRVADGRFTGTCESVNGWVRVTTATGVTGWVLARQVRKVRNAGSARVPGRAALACVYRVTHVRRVSFLNVRSGAGLRFRSVAKLRVADGRLTGACKATRGWIKVRAANGKRGWASAGYLRKVTK